MVGREGGAKSEGAMGWRAGGAACGLAGRKLGRAKCRLNFATVGSVSFAEKMSAKFQYAAWRGTNIFISNPLL